ncbi:MAG: DUF2283 domain-containing protein [Nitrospira sp.]|nr:DUF2283 domain-containing protein [Nitrospira sp.]
MNGSVKVSRYARLHYEKGEIIGITILNASKREQQAA